MSVRSVFSRRSVAGLSTVHESVIGMKTTVKRFPTMGVPSVTELSRVGLYQRRCVEFASPRSVASVLRSVKQRSVASASVAKRSVESLASCVPAYRVSLCPVASALQSLRRTALAKKCQRIAGRFARPAADRPRQQLQ